MTDDGARSGPEARELTYSEVMAAAHELDRLRAEYPQFTFNRDGYGRHGTCWVAQRIDRTGYGVHTVITTDLSELHAALAQPVMQT